MFDPKKVNDKSPEPEFVGDNEDYFDDEDDTGDENGDGEFDC